MHTAPVRIDFAGGWTDVPPFSSREGGAVLNAALALHVGAECRPRTGNLRLSSEDLGLALEFASPAELTYDGHLDLLKAAVRQAGLGAGWEIVARSEAPAGGGLGASGALGVALVSATRTALGAPPEPSAAAELAHLLEVEELGVAGGKQDQYAAALGGFLYLEFEDPTVRVTRLRLDPAFIAELEARTVLCFTGTSRISGDMISRVMHGFESGHPKIVGAFLGIRAAAEDARQALANEDIDALANAVGRNWIHQQELDPGMSTAAMERVEATARAVGAIAGKACGAGAGGCMVFITAAGAAARVRDAVAAAGAQSLPVRFDPLGVRASG